MIKIFLVLLSSAIFAVACDSAPNASQSDSKVEKVTESIKQVASVKPAVKLDASLDVKAVVEIKPVESEPKVEKARKETVVKTSMSGEQVYNQSCQNCHATGAAGSPKLEDAANWKKRIDKGIDVLYQSAIKGVPSSAMMPKGTCSKCSDDELKAAVDFMLSKVN